MDKNIEEIYAQAISAMETAMDEAEFKYAASLFSSVASYKDAAFLSESCLEKAEEARLYEIYSRGCSLMDWGKRDRKADHYEKAIQTFSLVVSYKDAEEKIALCRKQLAELEEERIEKEMHDAKVKKEREEEAKKRKKRLFSVLAGLLAFGLVLALLFAVIIPANKRKDAIPKHGEEFVIMFEKLKEGDKFTLGTYPQAANGEEVPISWVVLKKKGLRALVISEYVLDAKAMQEERADITWENASLRHWLNNDFYNTAFSQEDQTKIAAKENETYHKRAGKPGTVLKTMDKVFFLSQEEAGKYFRTDATGKCEATAYAKAKGVNTGENGGSWWWLRVRGDKANSMSVVAQAGTVFGNDRMVNLKEGGVRPVMWIDLNQ